MKMSEMTKSPNIKEILRFGITGVVSTLVTYAVYYLMLFWLNASISFTIGYVVAFIVNYIMTVSFTFKVKASAKNGTGFIVSNIINYGFCMMFLNLFIWSGLSKQVAPIPMYAICIPINYLIVRFVMKKEIPINYYVLFIPFLFLVLYFLPYIILGEGAFVTIHDYLDLTIGHLKSLKDNGLLFSDGEMPIMYGVPRSTYTPFFLLPVVLTGFLDMHLVVLLSSIFVKIVAITGMYVLCLEYIFAGNKSKIAYVLSVIISVLFAFIPFYQDYGLSSAGLPLVIYCFLNLYYNKRVIFSLTLLFIHTLCSSLVLSGLFVCIVAFSIILILLVKKKHNILNVFLGLVVLSVGYLLTSFHLFSSLFDTSSLSNRAEMVPEYFNFFSAFKQNIMYSICGMYHCGNIGLITGLATLIFTLYVLVDSKLRNKSILSICLVLFSCVILSSFYLMLRSLLPEVKILTSFQFDRFYFLYPTLIFLLIAYSIYYLSDKKKFVLIFIFLSIIFVGLIRQNTELKLNYKLLCKKSILQPTFKQFYDTDLFLQIKKSNNIQNNTKVVSIGIYPSIAEYNGFYTIDSYMSMYSLDFKHDFRKVIGKELEKSEDISVYFDEWGNRCYLFSAELGRSYVYGKHCGKTIKNLDIDTAALKNMGCQYIISAVPIENYEALSLEFIDSYTTSKSYWKIYVYKV